MAQGAEPRSRPEPGARPWVAFLAGAVAMLAIVLVGLAWLRMRDAAGVLRADVALPTRDLPSLPTQPPPEGPKAPRLPLPDPR